jgi:uncharacterized protein
VRAMYMYTGAADVASLTGDEGYVQAMRRVWEDVVFRNMYITGGIGSAGSNEGFSVDYDLPNEQAYCETCASVGMVFWNQRMNALTGKGEYIDVLEKSLYNGALDGLSLSGDHFFYGNPLASTGKNARREWFGTACCPANIARLVASLGNYIYARSRDGIWINLFVGSNTHIQVGNNEVALAMQTNYPWDGRVALSVDPAKKANFGLHIRIPGWATGKAAPGDLYVFADSSKITGEPVLQVNGKTISYTNENGYAVITRDWKKGDKVIWTIPMTVRRVRSKQELTFDSNRVALQRGPIMYCVEGADNNGRAWNIILPDNTQLSSAKDSILSEPVITINGEVPVTEVSADGLHLATTNKKITAIPYYTWCNRGSNEMQVWLPTSITNIKLNY